MNAITNEKLVSDNPVEMRKKKGENIKRKYAKWKLGKNGYPITNQYEAPSALLQAPGPWHQSDEFI